MPKQSVFGAIWIFTLNTCTVEPPYNGHLGTYLSGLCREVAVMGGYQLEDLSE